MIRDYQSGDKAAVIAIWRKTNAMAHPFLSAEFVTQAEEMISGAMMELAEIWIVEEAGEPVGFIALLGNEIGGLFVDPDHQGHGLGRALVDHVVPLKKRLTLEVFEKNTAAQRFYAAYGFIGNETSLHEMSGERVIHLRYPA